MRIMLTYLLLILLVCTKQVIAQDRVNTTLPKITAAYPYPFGLITTEESAPIAPKKQGYPDWRDKVWNDIKAQIKPVAGYLEQNLKESMNKPAAVESDNW